MYLETMNIIEIKFKQIDWINFSPRCLKAELNSFQVWYNCVKTHSNLNDRTPAEFFTNKKTKGKGIFISDWCGVLSGYYFPD